VVPIFYVLANVGNLLSIWIFSQRSWRKNVCVFYFTIYIIFNTCYINSTTLASIFSFGYKTTVQNSSVVLCKIYIYVAFLFATLSPTVLILASIDRLLISSQNIDTRLYSSKRLAYFSISISTVFWIVFNIHVLIKVNIQQFAPSTFICYYDLSKSYLDFVFYSLLTIQIIFGVIMLILSVLSFKNIHHIRTIPREKRQQIRSMKKKDFQLLRCLFVQGVVYITFALLIDGDYVYAAATRDQIQTPLGKAISNFLSDFFTFFYNIQFGASFYIFVTISKAFRHELKRMGYKICGKDLMPIREEEENRQNNVELNVIVVSNVVLPS
jgi:hypothetical protein